MVSATSHSRKSRPPSKMRQVICCRSSVNSKHPMSAVESSGILSKGMTSSLPDWGPFNMAGYERLQTASEKVVFSGSSGGYFFLNYIIVYINQVTGTHSWFPKGLFGPLHFSSTFTMGPVGRFPALKHVKTIPIAKTL